MALTHDELRQEADRIRDRLTELRDAL